MLSTFPNAEIKSIVRARLKTSTISLSDSKETKRTKSLKMAESE